VGNLARAVELMRAHEADLGEFLTAHPEGLRLLAYLKGVSEHLVAERGELLSEVETLARSVEHIKEIVAVQQGYARAPGGTEEKLAASALVADALRMLDELPGRGAVETVREIADDPQVTIDKHKFVQILINLVKNARHACEANAGVAGRIVVRVERAVPDLLRITVADNGVGIPPENLARVFEHGFTTRKDGHGFGLHGAALMAQELGGTLNAASDGPGRGATFTLALPLRAERGEESRPRKRLGSVG
jgi:signal transduction histidine kinase